jgi:peptidoglycan/LPS O-acetylase OafA/YrhL
LNSRFYRPELDIIRLIAFLTVFFHHTLSRDPRGQGVFLATVADAASFGLPLFFVLSAYLITTLLLREVQKTGTVSVTRFYARRVLRIWPLYFASLLVGLLWSVYHHLFHTEWRWYLAALLMCANFTTLLPATALGHLWSISVEEQFYLIWPTLMRRLTRRGLIIAAGVFIAAANAMLVYDGLRHVPAEWVIWYNSLVQFEMFAAGILLAIFTVEERSWPSSRFVRLILIASVPTIWFVAEYFTKIKLLGQGALEPGRLCLGYASVAISCAVLIYAVLGSEGWPRWLVHMGKVSYGLYVFHVPVLIVIRRSPFSMSFWLAEALALILTSALALLSYQYFEMRFLKMKQRLEVIPSRPVDID